MKSILFSFLLASSAFAADYTLPSEYQGNWTASTHVGVSGGIEQYQTGGASARTTLIDVTQAPYSADNTGASDCTTAINDAIAAATTGQVVYLPAGTYRCNSQINVGPTRDNITMRGDGATLTIIDSRWAGNGIRINGNEGWTYSETPQTVTGTKVKGTSALAVSSSADFAAGYLVRLDIAGETDNTRIQAGAVPVLNVDGRTATRFHMAKVTSVSAGIINIDPPLLVDYSDYAVTVSALQYSPGTRLENFGLEDLTVSGEVAGVLETAIFLDGVSNCWIKNVDCKVFSRFGIWPQRSYRLQVDQCRIGPGSRGGANGSGIISYTNSSCLFVNNILDRAAPLMETNSGDYNNVWAYNFGTSTAAKAFDVNHGPHNEMCLFEGNVTAGYQSDGYFGGASYHTFFRNWFHASPTQDYAVNLNRFTRKFANIGNVFGWSGSYDSVLYFGYPNIGNIGTNGGTATPTTGDFWGDWKTTGTVKASPTPSGTVFTVTVSNVGDLSTSLDLNLFTVRWASGASERVASSTAGDDITSVTGNDVTITFAGSGAFPTAGTTVEIWPGSGGFQERDMDVETSTLMVHNMHANLAGTGTVEDSTADVLPSSMVYASQPTWWGAMAWPPVNPDGPTYSVEIIPAGYRFTNGESASGATITTGSLSIGGTLSIGN